MALGVFAKSPGGRAAPRRSKYFLRDEAEFEREVKSKNSSCVVKHNIHSMTDLIGEDRVGIKRISPAAALQNEAPFDSFEPAEVLEEPCELDRPVDSPSPEPSIMEDGILWRARVLESLRRRNDILSASKERESVLRGGSTPNRRTYNCRSLEHFLFVAHSAPEYEVRKLLE